jgi:hypothetical protein
VFSHRELGFGDVPIRRHFEELQANFLVLPLSTFDTEVTENAMRMPQS